MVTAQVWELALESCGHARRLVGVAALDAWLDLQDVAVAARHPDLGAPAFSRLLEIIVGRCEADETDVDEDAEDALMQFREAAADVLVATYFLLREAYVTGVAGALTRAFEAVARGELPAVRRAEAAFYALRVARKEVVADAKARPDVAASRPARESGPFADVSTLEQRARSRAAAHQGRLHS